MLTMLKMITVQCLQEKYSTRQVPCVQKFHILPVLQVLGGVRCKLKEDKVDDCPGLSSDCD